MGYWKAQRREGTKEIFPSMATVQKPGGGKISPKKTPDKSKLALAKKELNIAKIKEKAVTKLAKDVKENIPMFQEGTAFKKGWGKFGFGGKK